MKKFISIALCLIIALASVNAYAVTIRLDGEIVTENAYLKDWTTFADAADIDPSLTGEIAVRKYYEDKGNFVGWDQENQTVMAVTEAFGNYYRIVNKATGNVIVAEDYNRDNLAPIVTEPFDYYNRDQVYRFARINDTQGYFVNMLSGRSLDVPDAKTDEGLQLIQYTYYSNTQQKMTLTSVGNGYYTITPAHCDMVLAEKDGKVIQTADKESEKAMWKLEYVSGPILSTLSSTDGYKLLDKRLQRAADEYFTDKIWITQQAMANAENKFAAADFLNLSAEEQANLIKDCLNFTASYQVGGTLASDHVAKYEIVSVRQEAEFDIWRGHKLPCWLYEVEMEGDSEGQVHKFTFVSNEEDKDAPMVARSIEAIARTPYAIRQYVHWLYWKKGDGANSFNGGGNGIWIRLNYEPQTSQQITSTLCHELGHILDSNVFPNNDVWSYAESLDACPISGYGSSNQAEDLAEFNKLFFMSRDTEAFEHLEEIYPNRCNVLRGMLYRADKSYFADYEKYEKCITDIEEILSKKTEGSVASEIDDSMYYMVKDKETGKVWTVTDASLDNEVPVVLKDAEEGNASQLFAIEKTSDTIRFFAKHSGSSLQLDDSGLPNKTINQYGGTWAINEQFAVYKADGGYTFESERYSLSIDVKGNNLVSGIEKQGKVFELVGVEKNTSNLNYTIRVNGTEKYLGAIDNNANYLFVQAVDEASEWKIKDMGDNVCTLVYTPEGTLIDILDLSTDSGKAAILWSATGAENQMFVKEEADNGVMFKAVHSGLYLTVNPDGSVTQEKEGSVFTITAAE
ncbi:MAG: RICIN domain-containing protein [Clostridia bacterium]|nr:RICIN domain-containing protein [Clostridia bacterium]